ncbi:unnamed protein product [Haemonchus placei]|uniref:MSP domain-containing protein n=1 Tax=Haemonchus placei TaxID=6290 RepID=A0A0N4WHS9_HAEPC|nr:unnamed protein product [Haemonchus placei]
MGAISPDPKGPIQQTRSNTVKVILRFAPEMLGNSRWIPKGQGSMVLESPSRSPATRDAEVIDPKRLAKAAVVKAKNTEMDALSVEIDGRKGEKFVLWLVKARHRANQDIWVVVKNSGVQS